LRISQTLANRLLSDDHEVQADIGVLNRLPHGLSSITFDIMSYSWSPEEINSVQAYDARTFSKIKKFGLALVHGPGQHIDTTEDETLESGEFRWRRMMEVTSTDRKGPVA
jgi:hypothetical protein